MNRFNRRFDTNLLAAPNVVPPIIAELFRHWVFPGMMADTGKHALRVSVRDGYLNL